MSDIRKPAAASEEKADELDRGGQGLSRRTLLKSAVGAAVSGAAASLAGTIKARAQVQGLYTSNLPPEIPLPAGALTYLDKKQYIHNMEIISHISGPTISGGEPLMVMWAKGKQRLLPAPGQGDL